MAFTVTISGNADGVEAEQEVVDFLYKMMAIFRQEGSPADVHNAIVTGSHTSVTNLLSNPEPPVEEVSAPAPAKEAKPAWDTSVPDQVTFPSDLPADTVLPPDTEIHQSGPDTGTPWVPPAPEDTTTTAPPTPAPPATPDVQSPEPPLTDNAVPTPENSPHGAWDYTPGSGTPSVPDENASTTDSAVPANENTGSSDASQGGSQP